MTRIAFATYLCTILLPINAYSTCKLAAELTEAATPIELTKEPDDISPMAGLALSRARMAGGFVPQDKMTFDNLEKITRAASNISSLLASLPVGVRRDYALINKSRSGQFGGAKFPRALLSNSDSTFMITFAGKPGSRGFDVLEGVIFNELSLEFEPFEINYQLEKPLKRGGEKCAGCHGIPWRPIWDSYPFWPRTYGSVSGIFLPPNYPVNRGVDAEAILKLETEKFGKFVKRREKGRYRALIGSHTLTELESTNGNISLNLATLRTRQIAKTIATIKNIDPTVKHALRTTFYQLGHNRESPVDLSTILQGEALKQFIETKDSVRIETENLLYRLRKRKVDSHHENLNLPTLSTNQLFDLSATSLSDFDLEFMTHQFATTKENSEHYENSVTNYAALYFLWVKHLGRSFSELNMALDPREPPTLATPLTNG